MYPVLLSLGPIKADAYYVFWGFAVCLMLFWTRARAVSRYGFTANDVTDVLLWVIAGVFVGASLGGYLDQWSRYAESPIRLLYFWESGLSSGPGFIGGGLFGLYKLRKLSLSVDCFAESAAIPTAFMLSIGRWGCFFAGCCRGIPTSSFIGVRFPPGEISVIPSQLLESAAALLIGVFLALLERKQKRSEKDARRGALLWPLLMIFYGGYRLVFDFLRAGDRILGLRVGQYSGALALVVGVGWLLWNKKRSADGEGVS